MVRGPATIPVYTFIQIKINSDNSNQFKSNQINSIQINSIQFNSIQFNSINLNEISDNSDHSILFNDNIQINQLTVTVSIGLYLMSFLVVRALIVFSIIFY